MNHEYLMKHISYRLHTVVRRYTAEFIYIDSFCGRMGIQDCFTADELMAFFTSRRDIAFNFPVIMSFNGRFLYVFVPGEKYQFIIGPARFSEEVYLRWKMEVQNVDEAWLETVPVCGFKELAADVLLAFNICREELLDESGLLTENCIRQETDDELRTHFSELVFENREHGRRHNPYDQEFRECASIEQGELEQLKTAIKEDYIFSHLHDKICVQDIADELGLNANYLSELFHQCEKISLTDFIRREKMNLVKNLLIYSRYSCSEIATYLGYSSQSHMGKQFKECMGMTPNQYRRVYGVREFDV